MFLHKNQRKRLHGNLYTLYNIEGISREHIWDVKVVALLYIKKRILLHYNTSVVSITKLNIGLYNFHFSKEEADRKLRIQQWSGEAVAREPSSMIIDKYLNIATR